MLRLLPRFSLSLLVLAATGCAGMSHTDSGALVGGGLGTAAGAIIGHQAGNTGAGAVLGAATGALAGSLVGNAEDARLQRDAALAYADDVRRHRAALTNADVIRMAQSGVGDDVILGAVRANGGNLDLSPNGLISMKQQGVSDRLIQSLQTLPMTGPLPAPIVGGPPPVVVSPVVVPPRPSIVFDFHHHHRPWRHHHWRRHHHHHHW